VAVGLTAPQMASFAPLVAAAREAFNDAVSAREQAKAATQKYYNAVADMDGPGRDYIATIKAFAETTGNPNVYVLAQVPPPAAPSPVPGPTTPTDLRGSIDASGILTLAWEAERSGPSSGVVFLVSRKAPGESAFTFIGATFEKVYVDATFVACEGPFAYRIQAQRGGQSSGFAGPLEINLGNGSTLTAGFVGGMGSAAEAA